LSESGKRYTGGCLCGQVRYEAEGEPLYAGLCYCTATVPIARRRLAQRLSRSWALRAAPFALTGAHDGQSGLTDPRERSANKSRVSPGRCAKGCAPAPLHHRANSAQMLKVGAQVGLRCNLH
jgi:hypothetical protein